MYLQKSKVDLAKYNTMGLHSIAEIFYIPLTEEDLIEIVRQNKQSQIVIIGAGSNTICAKEYYDKGYCFIYTGLLNSISYLNDMIEAQVGLSLSNLAWGAAARGIKGYTYLEDIPGTVGGACVMNAGTFSGTFGDNVLSICYYDIDDDSVKSIVNDGNLFSQRECQLMKAKVIILRIYLQVSYGDKEQLILEMNEFKKKRYMKQPREYPNAGSVFKRPVVSGEPQYVWKLLETVGMRGYRIGGAQVSDKHPGFIVNYDNASNNDVVQLMNKCCERVREEFGIGLEHEWKIIY